MLQEMPWEDPASIGGPWKDRDFLVEAAWPGDRDLCPDENPIRRNDKPLQIIYHFHFPTPFSPTTLSYVSEARAVLVRPPEMTPLPFRELMKPGPARTGRRPNVPGQVRKPV